MPCWIVYQIFNCEEKEIVDIFLDKEKAEIFEEEQEELNKDMCIEESHITV